MSDGLLISPPPPKKPINWDRWLGGAALVVSLSAATFVALQYQANNRQAKAAEDQVRIALQARDDARQAAKDQADDVKRAREAADKSADAAQKLADGMQRSARAAESSARAGNESLKLSREVMILNEQPLLETVQAQLLKPLAAAELIPVSVETLNFGKGPAKNIDIREGLNASEKWEFDFDNSSATHTDTLGTSGGITKPELTTTKQIMLSQRGVDGIKAGSIHLYIYGTVQYEQPGIAKPARQSYAYCLYYIPNLDKVEQSPFADCPEHPPLPK